MPSTVMIPVSGGMGLVLSGQGNLFSGTWSQTRGGIQLRYDVSGPGIVYMNLPNASGGFIPTATSGLSGVTTFSDGMPLGRGDSFFIPKVRLSSGLETPRFAVPAAASGGFLFWQIM